MKKNKGFTLVELLAVIVILAIIALIATPAILRVIEDSRKKSAEDSMYGYIKAVEQGYVKAQMDIEAGGEAKDYNGIYKSFSSQDIKITSSGEQSLGIELQGTAPSSDENNVLVISDGEIDCAHLKFGKYYVDYNGSDGTAEQVDSATSTCGTTPVETGTGE